MTFKPKLRVETELGIIQVPVVECDSCQAESVEELAGGWLNLSGIGPPIRLVVRPPEGGYHFCGFSCLSTATQAIMKIVS